MCCNKKILIAGRPEQVSNYCNALGELEASYEVMGNGTNPADCDGLLLPGGGDIDPVLFGEENHGSRVIDGELDREQLALLDFYVQKKKPVLGICKGMQLINIYFGGGLIQDLPTGREHEYVGKDQVHDTDAEAESILARLYGTHFPVNSAHHQGIGLPGKEITVIQRASDGVAEAIVHNLLPVIGVQWHPERMCFAHRREDTPDGRLLLEYFLSVC